MQTVWSCRPCRPQRCSEHPGKGLSSTSLKRTPRFNGESRKPPPLGVWGLTYENDVAVGQLLNYLETHDDPRNPGHKLIDNTLFIFSSDNGAENAGKESSGYYRGRKAHIHEGGHRVPTIAFWKQGNIGDATPGRTSHITYGLNDLILSIADLAGIKTSPRAGFAEDSTNIAPFLTA